MEFVHFNESPVGEYRLGGETLLIPHSLSEWSTFFPLNAFNTNTTLTEG